MRYSNYCGNENVAFIYFNEWADPLIEYKGFQWPAWMIEDALRDDFNSAGLPDTESHFVAFVNGNVENYLDDVLAGMGSFDIDFIENNAPGHFEALRDEIEYGDDETGKYSGWRRVSDSEVRERFRGVSFTVADFISVE